MNRIVAAAIKYNGYCTNDAKDLEIVISVAAPCRHHHIFNSFENDPGFSL